MTPREHARLDLCQGIESTRHRGRSSGRRRSVRAGPFLSLRRDDPDQCNPADAVGYLPRWRQGGEPMRCASFPAALGLAATLFVTVAANSQTLDESRARCKEAKAEDLDPNVSPDDPTFRKYASWHGNGRCNDHNPAKAIAGCSAIIQSRGRASMPRTLGILLIFKEYEPFLLVLVTVFASLSAKCHVQNIWLKKKWRNDILRVLSCALPMILLTPFLFASLGDISSNAFIFALGFTGLVSSFDAVLDMLVVPVIGKMSVSRQLLILGLGNLGPVVALVLGVWLAALVVSPSLGIGWWSDEPWRSAERLP